VEKPSLSVIERNTNLYTLWGIRCQVKRWAERTRGGADDLSSA